MKASGKCKGKETGQETEPPPPVCPSHRQSASVSARSIRRPPPAFANVATRVQNGVAIVQKGKDKEAAAAPAAAYLSMKLLQNGAFQQ